MTRVLRLAVVAYTQRALGTRTAAESLEESWSDILSMSVQAHSNEVAGEALELDQTEAIRITEFKEGWAQKGYEVIVLDSLSDFKNHFEARAWKKPSDQIAKTSAPFTEAVPLSSVVESQFFYHGGNIQPSRYGAGVSSINFDRTRDRITGPCFFTFENAFTAALYGGEGGWNKVKAVEANGTMSEIGYVLMMELKVSQPDKCVGLVPSYQHFFIEIAKLGQAQKGAFIEKKCGKDCAFIATNWALYDKPGYGSMPYEFRFLPASVARCNISLNNIIAVRGDWDVSEFVDDIRPSLEKAGKLFKYLLKLNAGNHDQEMEGLKQAEIKEEQFKA